MATVLNIIEKTEQNTLNIIVKDAPEVNVVEVSESPNINVIVSGGIIQSQATFQEVTDNGNTTTNDIVVQGEVLADSVQLSGGTGDQGTMSWNTDEETIDIIQNGATLQVGQEIHIHCKNQTGSDIADGVPVYVTGTLGSSGRLTIAPMIADNSIDAKFYIGITTESIPNGEDGKVTTFGKVRGLDTSSYSEGATLYVSETTAGTLVTTRPTAPNLDLETAIVINSHENNGTIFVRANQGHYITQNHDVYVNSITDGQVLSWNAANQRFENSDVEGGLWTEGTGGDIYYTGGDVGIGESDPDARLHVKSSSNTVAVFQGQSSNPFIYLRDASYTSRMKFQLVGPTTYGSIGMETQHDLALITSNSEKVRITTTGNVGIGTTSPTQKLEVNGNAQFGSTIFIGDTNGKIVNGGGNFTFNNRYAGSLILATSDTERLRIDSVGNVGIGTTSPSAKLHVNGGIKLSDDQFLTWNSSNTRITGQTGYMQFQVAATDAMRITSTGLGIGTTSPSEKLEVNGNILADGLGIGNNLIYSNSINLNNSGTFRIGNAEFLSKTSNDLSIYQQKIIVLQSGNVGIGTTSPQEKLHVQGIARFGNAASNYLLIDGSVNGSNHVKLSNRFNGIIIETNTGAGDPDIVLAPASGGNVGIGISSPAYTLDVVSPSSGTIRLRSTSTGATQLRFENTGTGFLSALVTDNNGLLRLDATNIQLNPTGNVGIGTTSPSSKLHIYSTNAVSDGYAVSTTSGGETAKFTPRVLDFSTPNTPQIKGIGLQFKLSGNSSLSAGNAFSYLPNDTRQSLGDTDAEQAWINIEPLIEQTSTANYVGLLMDVTETSTGSGDNKLIDLRVGGTSKFNIDNGGQISIQDGTATNPAITFYSENGTPNTGIFREAENKVGISAGGIKHLFTELTYEFGASGPYIRSSGFTASTPMYSFGSYTTTGMFRPIGLNEVAFTTSGTERMRITSTGVGIGTTSPSVTLDVNGTIQANNELRFVNSEMRIYRSSNDMKFRTANLDRVVIDSSGNFELIGTTIISGGSPKGVRINEDGIQFQRSNGDFGGGSIDFIEGGLGGTTIVYGRTAAQLGGDNAGTNIKATFTGDIRFNTSTTSTPSERMRIDTSGNLGIGTTSPSTKLHVVGNMTLDDGNTNISIGDSSTLSSITTGTLNTGIGTEVLSSITTGSYNVGIGYQSLNSATGQNFNVGIGYQSLKNVISSDNIGIGALSLIGTTTGQSNLSIGSSSLRLNTTGSYNTAIGYQALYANTTDNSNLAIGYRSLRFATASYNLAIGSQSLYSATTGGTNTAVGWRSLYNLTTGIRNTALGYRALDTLTTANSNIAIGYNALFANTGASNVSVGTQALEANTTGASNVAVGGYAMNANTTASDNIAIGSNALDTNTTGIRNVAIGSSALTANTTGTNNIGIGFRALYLNTYVGNNIGIGLQALYNTTTGGDNIAIGSIAVINNTTGVRNTGIGYGALGNNTTGGYNTGLGYLSLYDLSSGSNNMAFGYIAGRYIADGTTSLTTSNNSIFLGNDTKASADGNTNEIVIGYDATGNGSNSVTLGNSSITKTVLRGNVGIGTITPSEKLHVLGTGMLLESSSYADSGFLISDDIYDYRFGTTPPTNNTNYFQLGRNSSNTEFKQSSGSWIYKTNNVELFRILSDGKVGIGTTSPTVSLEVMGSGIKSVAMTVKGTNGSYWLYDRDTTNRANDSFRFTKSVGTLTFTDRTYSGGFDDHDFMKHVFSTSSTSSLYINPKTNLNFQLNGSDVGRWNTTGLGVGTTSIDASAKLQVDSTTQGVLLPRLTTTEVNAISSPATGLTVYNTTLNQLCFYNGTEWRKVSDSTM